MSKEVETANQNTTLINQYGEKSLFVSKVNNLTLNMYSDRNSTEFSIDGKPFTPTIPTRYDRESRILYLGNEEITLPLQLTPPEELNSDELPYINALCEIYTESTNKMATPDTIPATFTKHCKQQRKAYFAAESVQHSIREIFIDGSKQFNALKEDIFEGIEPTYFSRRHTKGLDRLEAVLEKVTSTTIQGSTLTNLVGLISNLEKKGVCHILVNDGRIKSWVNIDDASI